VGISSSTLVHDELFSAPAPLNLLLFTLCSLITATLKVFSSGITVDLKEIFSAVSSRILDGDEKE